MASTNIFNIEAGVRHEIGKGASRRLRLDEKVPGVVYGGGKDPVSLSLEHKHVAKALEHEAFYSHILTLKTGTESEKVILKDVQRHPFKARILHVDFLRVRADEKLHMHIPLHFLNADKAPGLKEGGVISHIMSDIEVSCLPADLPEYIAVDLANMAMNDIIHISNITLPKGVESVALAHEDDKAVASLHVPRIVEEEIPSEAPVAPAEVPAMAQKTPEEIAAEKAAAAKSKK